MIRVFLAFPLYLLFSPAEAATTQQPSATVNWPDPLGAVPARAGDVNGDGYADVLISGQYPPASAIYYGSSAGLSLGVARVWGDICPGCGGDGGAGVGDVNGDGYDDVLVPFSGFASLYLGSAGGLWDTPATTIVGDLDSPVASAAGDLDGDGFDDALIGTWLPGSDPSLLDSGVLVFSGGAGGLSSVSTSELTSISSGDHFGLAAAGAGDVDGDGYADVIVGAGGGAAPGRAYVYSGGFSGLGADPAEVLDDGAALGFGESVAAAGDVDGDGYSDVLVGEPTWSSGLGRALVFRGSAAGVDGTWLADLRGTSSNPFAKSISGAGDVDGDGFDDVIASQDTPHAQTVGVVFLGSTLGTVPEPARLLAAFQAREFLTFGFVAGVGDIDGDGLGEVLVGEWGYDSGWDGGPADGWSSDAPTVYLYSGYPTDNPDRDGDGLPSSQDCDDDDATVGALVTLYLDADADGWGGTGTGLECGNALGYSDLPGDCNDADPTIHPGATDIPGDGIDQDCDGTDGSGGADSDDAPESGSPKHGCVGCGTGTATPAPFALLAVSLVLARRRRA